MKCLFFLASTVALAALGTAAAQNPVIDWNNVAITAALAGSPVTSPGSSTQPGSFVYLAYVHLAVYDAVNAIDHGHRSYGPHITAPSSASKEAAAIEAAYRVLLFLFPDQAATLTPQYDAALAAIPDGTQKNDGVQAGLAAANSIIALRTGDGRGASVLYTWPLIPTAGVWIPTPPGFAAPLLPGLGKMTPFTMSSSSQFRPGPPPKLSSEKWTESFDEVKSLGAVNSTVRTPQQTEIGLFWTDHAGKQYSRAFRALALGRDLNISDSARLFAMLYAAGADGAIGCWDAKYNYSFWRPVTAIQNGDIDGNPNTVKDASWEPYVPTPNHPEYPSGHGCVTGALSAALEHFFRTSQITLVVTSTVTNTTRTFTNTKDWIEEVAGARIYMGFHYRFSLTAGTRLGTKVARHMGRNYFRRVNEDGREDDDRGQDDEDGE